MKTVDLIERVRNRIAPEEEREPELNYQVTSQVQGALEKLARMVAERPELRNLLVKTFTVSANLGTASLVTPLTATEPLLLDSLGQIYASGITFPLERLPDRAALFLDRTTQFGYFAVENSTLYVKGSDGLTGTYTGTLSIVSSYIPTLANLPISLEEELIEILCDMVKFEESRIPLEKESLEEQAA